HVIDEQCHAPRMAHVIQGCGYLQAVNMLHCGFPWLVRSKGSAISTDGSNRNSNGRGASSAMYSHSITPAFVRGKSAMWRLASSTLAHSNTMTTPGSSARA